MYTTSSGAGTKKVRKRKPAAPKPAPRPSTSATKASTYNYKPTGAPTGKSRTAAKRTTTNKKIVRQDRSADKLLRSIADPKVGRANVRKAKTYDKRLAHAESQADSIAERALEGGVVGLFDRGAAKDVRKTIYGKESLSPAEVALAVIPGAGAAKGAARILKAAKGVEKAADTAVDVSKIAKRKPRGLTQPKKPRVPTKVAKKTSKHTKVAGRKARAKVTRKKEGVQSLKTKSGRREATRRTVERVHSHPLAGAAAVPAVAGPAAAIVEGHLKANVGEAIKRTAETAPGLFTAPLGAIANVGVTGGRAASEALHSAGVPGFRGYTSKEITDPTVETAKEFYEFNKELVETYGSGDPDKIEKAIEEKYGYAPDLMVGLGARPMLRKPAAAGVSKVRRVAESARAKRGEKEPKRLKGKGRRRPETLEPQKVFAFNERRAARREEAERAAITDQRKTHLQTEAGKPIAKHVKKIKGRQGVRPSKRTDFPENITAFAAERGIPLGNRKAAHAELGRIRDSLPKGSPNRAMVENFIERYDDLAKDKHFVGAVEAMREGDLMLRAKRVEREPSKLLSDERSRLQPIAVTHGKRLPEERQIPGLEKHATKGTTPKAGRDLAKAWRSRAADLRRQSKAARERAKGAKAGARSPEARLAARQKADRYEEAADVAKAKANEIENALAREKRERVRDADFRVEIAKVLKDKELEDPAWMRHIPADVNQGNMNVSRAYTGGKIPPKEKFRGAHLQRKGNVDYNFATYMAETINRRASDLVIRDHVDDFANESVYIVKPDGKDARVVTGDEARFAETTNQISFKHNVLFPVQEFKRVLRSGNDEAALGLVRESLKGDIAKLEKTPGKKYIIKPREEMVEFLAQMERGDSFAAVRKISRFTNRALLGTSPAWAISQYPAEGIMALSAHPYRFSKQLATWHKIPAEKRRAWMAEVEGATGGGLMNEVQLLQRPRTAHDVSNAFWMMDRTPVGRTLKSFATANPLIAMDRWKGANIRGMAAAAHADHLVNSFLRNGGRLYKTQAGHLKAMRKLPMEERMDWYLKHPEEMKEIASYTRDTLGSWSAMTRYERMMGPFAAFYPFMRFSLRTIWRTFPARHPLKAAILWNMASANTNELRKLLGTDDSTNLFTYANTPLRTGKDGSVDQMLPLSRIAPGINVFVDAGVDPDTEDFGALARVAAPWISAAALPLLGHDPVSGRPLSETQTEEAAGLIGKAKMAGASLLALPSVVRAADTIARGGSRGKSSVPIVGDRNESSIARLFSAITGPKAVRSYAFPFQPQELNRSKDLVRAESLLHTAFDKPSDTEKSKTPPKGPERDALNARQAASDKAWEELDKMMIAYGVTTKKAQKKEKSQYGERVYGSGPEETSGGNGIFTKPSSSSSSSGGGGIFK